MSVLTSIDLEAIDRQSREIDFRRGFLTVLASVLFAIGFMFGVMSRALAWGAIAIREGYRAGRRAGVQGAAVARAG